MLSQHALDLVKSGKAPASPGQCLALVREAVEGFFGMAPYSLYTLLEAHNRELAQNRNAYQAEKAFLDAGFGIRGPVKPNDLVFARVTMPYGHVGIIYEDANFGLCVVENTSYALRQHWYGIPYTGSPNCLSPLSRWDLVSSIIRLPDGFGK